jgi:hypothetical protein
MTYVLQKILVVNHYPNVRARLPRPYNAIAKLMVKWIHYITMAQYLRHNNWYLF